jgi:hypothetical protein
MSATVNRMERLRTVQDVGSKIGRIVVTGAVSGSGTLGQHSGFGTVKIAGSAVRALSGWRARTAVSVPSDVFRTIM